MIDVLYIKKSLSASKRVNNIKRKKKTNHLPESVVWKNIQNLRYINIKIICMCFYIFVLSIIVKVNVKIIVVGSIRQCEI